MPAKPWPGSSPERSSIGPGPVGSSCCRCFTANATGHLGISSLARGSRFFVSRFIASDRQNTGTDQVREPLPLFRAQERVDLLQGMNQRVANFRGAPNAAFVHLGLCPLRLELVQDSGQFGDLLLVQIELVGEESERPSDAKP